MRSRSQAQRRFLAECAAMAVVALLWLVCLVLGLGGQQTTQAISNFGLIAAAGAAGITCIRTARFSSPRQSRMWKLMGASALSWASGQAAWTWYETVLGRTLDRRNFQKKMLELGVLVRVGQRRGEGVRRAPYLYRFNVPRYTAALREGITLGRGPLSNGDAPPTPASQVASG